MGLTAEKVEMLRQLVLTSPDPVIRGLDAMLSKEVAATGGLAAVRQMVSAEAADRQVRNLVMAPVEPMFLGPAEDGRLAFPRGALGLVWRALKARHAELMAEAAELAADFSPEEDEAAPLFDALCAHAARGLREGLHPDYVAAVQLCEDQQRGLAAHLASCLDLSFIVRPTLPHLPEWVARMTEERTVAARLAYRDAVAVAEDAGPRFFEMLAAALPEPWTVIRIISAVMDKPSERYLNGSELAPFGQRLLHEIDARILSVRTFDASGGLASGRRAGQVVQCVTEQIAELEECVELGREAPWGLRVAKQRRALAAAVEYRLKDLDVVVFAALPLATLRYAGRVITGAPEVSEGADKALVDRALGLLAFADEVRACAGVGGFGVTRARVMEMLDKRLDSYIEDVLDQLRTGEAEDAARARGFLDIAASFVALSRDEKAAQIVRRRAAAA